MTPATKKTWIAIVGVLLIVVQGVLQYLQTGTFDPTALLNALGGLQLGAALIKRPGDEPGGQS